MVDAIEDGIAAKNGIGPGMKIIAVNGRKYSQEFLVAAMREAQNSHQPIQLLVENTEYYRTVSLDYFDGPRHPHLMRDNSKPDMLSDIFEPKVTTPPAPSAGRGVEAAKDMNRGEFCAQGAHGRASYGSKVLIARTCLATASRGPMFKGFREFILRGNVIDLAVAVVIGAAFGAVITAFVGSILTPLIAAIVG